MRGAAGVEVNMAEIGIAPVSTSTRTSAVRPASVSLGPSPSSAPERYRAFLRGCRRDPARRLCRRPGDPGEARRRHLNVDFAPTMPIRGVRNPTQ